MEGKKIKIIKFLGFFERIIKVVNIIVIINSSKCVIVIIIIGKKRKNINKWLKN